MYNSSLFLGTFLSFHNENKILPFILRFRVLESSAKSWTFLVEWNFGLNIIYNIFYNRIFLSAKVNWLQHFLYKR